MRTALTFARGTCFRRGLLLALAGWLLTTNALAGGGWTRKKKKGYVKAGLTTVSTDRYHPLPGGTISTARFRQQVYSLYGEYGLTDRLEATLSFPVFRRATFPDLSAGQGVGDPEIGMRYGVLTGRWPLAVGVAVEAPLGNPNTFGRSRTNPDVYLRLPTGDGEWNVWTRAALSHSLRKVPAFFTLSAGYNKRTGGFTSQYSYGAQVGYQFLGKLWLTATARTLDNVRPPDLTKFGTIGLGEGVAYSTASLGASYALTKKLSVTADWATGFGKLRNVYSGSQYTVGVAWEW
ncbi:hypothetical protein SAMN02745146_3561 [Hymenobacter daecheongensis DSM 21074]|uniref:MetA-pathway of phenol degradation n=1 Tax=Hymenobacter daecheongensis DSM 21074 TaxID=1121955 RepID=A0A1M6KTE7_9BACT|nr:hypothetical protein [Hymenobacter daecheongensis]SHJ62265.1 hypothetical protein SAMN02745146_3561 [Hymenobacter daecheongensis DSM 21074]